MITHSFRTLPALIAMVGLSVGAAAAEPAVMTSSLRKDGVLLVDGKPMLPYGFYISTRHTGDIRLKCVEEAHRVGANVMHIQGDWHEDTRFLDKAVELGIKIVAGHTETEAKLERVRRYKNHPAIIAWTLYDDANTLTTVEHLTKMNKLVKEVVPHRLTYIPLGPETRDILKPGPGFFECTDFVGWEMYPVANPKAADPTLRATETQLTMVTKLAEKAGRPYWILPQTFKWPGSRVPTPAEYRNLCYVGLINGARGVMPWSMYHMVDSPEVRARKKAEGKPAWEEWFLPESKELFTECGNVGAELKVLAPLLLEGKRTKLTDSTEVSAAIWRTDAESLLVVANLSETQQRSWKLKLPPGADGEPQSAFAERAGRSKRSGDEVSVDLDKAGVAVFRWKSK